MRPARYPYGPDRAQYGELWLPGGAAEDTVVIVLGAVAGATWNQHKRRPNGTTVTR